LIPGTVLNKEDEEEPKRAVRTPELLKDSRKVIQTRHAVTNCKVSDSARNFLLSRLHRWEKYQLSCSSSQEFYQGGRKKRGFTSCQESGQKIADN